MTVNRYTAPARALDEVHALIGGVDKLPFISKPAVGEAGHANRYGHVKRLLVYSGHGPLLQPPGNTLSKAPSALGIFIGKINHHRKNVAVVTPVTLVFADARRFADRVCVYSSGFNKGNSCSIWLPCR